MPGAFAVVRSGCATTISYLTNRVAKRLGIHGARNGSTRCESISAWRRAVCGDLTAALDFGRVPSKPIDTATVFRNGTTQAAVPVPQVFPVQEAQVRPASRTGYEFSSDIRLDGDRVSLRLRNTGNLGVALVAMAIVGGMARLGQLALRCIVRNVEEMVGRLVPTAHRLTGLGEIDIHD